MPAELVTFEEQVAVLEALLDALSVERCVLGTRTWSPSPWRRRCGSRLEVLEGVGHVPTLTPRAVADIIERLIEEMGG